jgi:hypothetical protein
LRVSIPDTAFNTLATNKRRWTRRGQVGLTEVWNAQL